MPVAIRLERWEGCTAEELSRAWGVPGVRLFASVGSTNDVARRLGEAGAPSATVVIAEEQLTGRGRAGRSWSSPPGLGLWLSVLHRPHSPDEIAPLPLRVALATAAAIEHGCDQTVGVKWPNDLLIGGRKVGGILCEGAWETGELRYVVIGIGLNLLHSWEDFPPEIRGTATSLRQASSQAISRFETASRVIEGLRREVLGGSRTEGLPRDLGGRDVLRSRRVEVLEPETGRVLAQGIADGIGPDGALLLWNASGSTEVRSGTIRVIG